MASLTTSIERYARRRFHRWASAGYQRHWRSSSRRRAAMVSLSMLSRPDWVRQITPAAFYSSKTPYSTDLDVPLWSNLGYWAQARTVVEAQAELARYLARAGAFAAGDEVLDAGCGCADQDILWSREWDLKRVVAIDITPVRAELGAARVARARLADRIEVRLGSATTLPFPEASFDKVTALESATHFNSREDFFREAFRVLRPGGRLALTDLVPVPNVSRSAVDLVLQRLTRRLFSIPEANVYSTAAYAAKLSRLGFGEVEIHSIANQVFSGCVRYRGMLAAGMDGMAAVEMNPEDFVASQWNSQWHDGLGLGDYVVVTARKPSAASAPN